MLDSTDNLLATAFAVLDKDPNAEIVPADLAPVTAPDDAAELQSVVLNCQDNYDELIRYDARFIATLYHLYFETKNLHWFTDGIKIHEFTDKVIADLLELIDNYTEICITSKDTTAMLNCSKDNIGVVFYDIFSKSLAENLSLTIQPTAELNKTLGDVNQFGDKGKSVLDNIIFSILSVLSNGLVDFDYCQTLPDTLKIARKTILEEAITKFTKTKYLSDKL